MKTSKLQIIDTVEGKIVARYKFNRNSKVSQVSQLADEIQYFIRENNLEDAVQENYDVIADELLQTSVWLLDDDTYILKLV